MNKEIVERLTGKTTCTLKNEAELTGDKPTSFTALITGVSGVFNLYRGKVLFVGSYDGIYSVNILVNDHELLRYCYLGEVESLLAEDVVEAGRKLGKVAKNRTLGFEYCTQWQGNSNKTVRMCGRLFFKQNPLDILNNLYQVPEPITIVEDTTPEALEYDFTDEEIDSGEWDIEPDSEEELDLYTGDEEDQEDVEIPNEDFDQPAAYLDMDHIDGFDPTQYIEYIQRIQDEGEPDEDTENISDNEIEDDDESEEINFDNESEDSEDGTQDFVDESKDFDDEDTEEGP